MLQGGGVADSSDVQPALVPRLPSETVPHLTPALALQVAELKHALAAQQNAAELSRKDQEQAQLMMRDLEAKLAAVAANSKAEASKAESQVRL